MKILITAVLAGALVMTQPSAAAQEAKSYTEDDYYVLSHIISAEAGNCSRDMMVSVGSVVLNRMSDDRFPDTIRDVVFQVDPTVQYAPITNGTFWNEPTETAREVAKELLETGSQIDASVVWQANFPQGEGTYDIIETTVGQDMYFCY